jgi:hypothetical protein
VAKVKNTPYLPNFASNSSTSDTVLRINLGSAAAIITRDQRQKIWQYLGKESTSRRMDTNKNIDAQLLENSEDVTQEAKDQWEDFPWQQFLGYIRA